MRPKRPRHSPTWSRIRRALIAEQERRRWTQTRMAQALGQRRQNYNKFLNGQITLGHEALRRAYRLGIPAEVFLR